MRTSLLIEREPFGEILAATLRTHWNHRHGAGHEVRWFPGRPGRDRREDGGAQIWSGNIHLNFFAAAGTPPEHFEVLRREYGRSMQPARRLVQAAYVWLACREPLRSRLAQVAFSVRPGVPEAGETVVLGGNRRLRLLHPRRGTSTVVLKRGFAAHYLDDEVVLRTEHAPACAPRLVHTMPAQGWYEEEYRPGTPVNRLPPREALGIEREAHEALAEQVIAKTLRSDDATTWVDRLLEDVAAFGSVLDRVGQRQNLEETLVVARRAVAKLVAPGGQIPTAMTHGDFQPANVLATSSGAMIIDWESAARRFSGYDALVYACGARGPEPLVLRVRHLLDSGEMPSLSEGSPWPGVEEGRSALRMGLLFFLLEELLFMLREEAEPGFLRIDTRKMSARLADLAASFSVIAG